MSTTAARRAARVVTNARRVVAIELLAASRALAFRQTEDPGCRLGAGTQEAFSAIQLALSQLDDAAIPSDRIECIAVWIDAGKHTQLGLNLVEAGG